MPLITMRNVHFGFGGPKLLEGVNFQINPAERVAVIGRNGCGKSTFLKLIQKELEIYSGEIAYQPNIKIAMLSQYVAQEPVGKVFDIIASGLGKAGNLLVEYHNILSKLKNEQQADNNEQLHKLHKQLDKLNAWQKLNTVNTVISMAAIEPEIQFGQLSAGLKRRVLMAKALTSEPDLLILDEPTNHLDIDSIKWLEDFLLRCQKAILFVTHDREFLKKISTRMVEIDRGKLFNWDCDYQDYLKRKEQILTSEQNQWNLFDKKLTTEEMWLRQGIKARRRRNEGRVRALMKMRNVRSQRKKLAPGVRMEINAARKSGEMVADLKNVNFSYDNSKTIIKDFSTTIMRGDRVGIVGPNGQGKTTLLKLLLNQLPATSGNIRHGANVQYAYFDQLHGQLDPNKSLEDNIGEGYGSVVVNGKNRHVFAYLADFLFDAEQAKKPVFTLSGGERNRLQIAKVFTKPSNVLVLDEPTNDLDVETLELLEDMLTEYPGTILMVSHDRAFLDNVVTSMLILEDDGSVTEYIGGYEDCLKWREDIKTKLKEEKNTAAKAERPKKKKPVKLTFKQAQELKKLPDVIEKLEEQIASLHEKMAEPAFYKQDGSVIAQSNAELASLENNLKQAYQRWEELSAIEEMAAQKKEIQ